MIPFLYETTEKNFTNGGLGALTDAITCTITQETNGSYELEMEYPIHGILWEQITPRRWIYANNQPFRIYKITKTNEITFKVYAEHCSYLLSYMTFRYILNADKVTPKDVLKSLSDNIVDTNPFTFDTQWDDTSCYFNSLGLVTVRQLLCGEEGSILDVFGSGFYTFDKWTVHLTKNTKETPQYAIRAGNNIESFSITLDDSDIFTAVKPYWTGTNSEGAEERTVLGYGEIVKGEYFENYPYQYTKMLDCSSAFQSVPTQDQLKEYSEAYLANNISKQITSMTFDFDSSLIQNIDIRNNIVGHKVKTITRPEINDLVLVDLYPYNIQATARITSITYDALRDKPTKYGFGYINNLAKTVKK
jgi:phage minor structural protein